MLFVTRCCVLNCGSSFHYPTLHRYELHNTLYYTSWKHWQASCTCMHELIWMYECILIYLQYYNDCFFYDNAGKETRCMAVNGLSHSVHTSFKYISSLAQHDNFHESVQKHVAAYVKRTNEWLVSVISLFLPLVSFHSADCKLAIQTKHLA